MYQKITVETSIQAPIEKIWEYWTEPEHIRNWCSASDDWHVPKATNDVKVGGKFVTRMEARDGSAGFNFSGIYTLVDQYKRIEYTADDGRKVEIEFIPNGDSYMIVETFEAEGENALEVQKTGWQSILDNFKKHVLEV